jgi:hypothetical protein
VDFVTDRREIPEWANMDAIDDNFGVHVDSASPQTATDGGQTQMFTRHTAEDSHGESYEFVRCEKCGRECAPPRRDRLAHTEDCPVRGDSR